MVGRELAGSDLEPTTSSMIRLDRRTGGFMEAAIPERIVEELRRVIEQAGY
jgi:hypothetical protein